MHMASHVTVSRRDCINANSWSTIASCTCTLILPYFHNITATNCIKHAKDAKKSQEFDEILQITI